MREAHQVFEWVATELGCVLTSILSVLVALWHNARRIVAVGAVNGFGSPEADETLEGVWRTLIAGCELVCVHTRMRHPALPRPKAVIVDVGVVIHSLSLSGC